MRHEISCPKCGHTFALSEALNQEIEVDLRQRLTAELQKKQLRMLQVAKEEGIEQSRHALRELETKVEAQADELRKAREQELALLRTKAQLQEQTERAELEARRRLEAERDTIRKEAQRQIIDEHRLQDADKNKQLQVLREQIEQLKRKAEQGSQQLQGDVQELELERALQEHFPQDEISPIKTGVRGADILQKVKSDDGKHCGTILWESKRVRKWNDNFIDKLLRDKAEAKADLAVLVTGALPDPITHMGSVKGVLLTTFNLAVCLAATLRVNLALLGHTRLALAGREDQKTRLFEYFMSPHFQEKMTMIADQLQQMQLDLQKEKAAMARIWTKRETQIEMVISGTAGLTGTLQVFYGSALPALPQFELPEAGVA